MITLKDIKSEAELDAYIEGLEEDLYEIQDNYNNYICEAEDCSLCMCETCPREYFSDRIDEISEAIYTAQEAIEEYSEAR